MVGGLLAWAAAAFADTSAFKIVDDDAMSSAVAEVRAEYLKDKPFRRLDATILVRQQDGSWKRGSYNPDALNYPASCVKLAYMAAAMRWCRENGHPYDYLDHAIGPMMEISSNEQTGVVVDAITGAPNLPDVTSVTDSRFAEWNEKRHYTEAQLARRGLLGTQTILHKTYPSNSGKEPTGAERLSRDLDGMNRMSPRLAASLMLEVVGGAWESSATAHMRHHLTHDRWKGNAFTGQGLPPGSIYENKPGNAYDTLEDIAYGVLPNGQQVIMAVFTDGNVAPYKSEPKPYGRSILSGFSEMVIDRLHLADGGPARLRIDDSDAAFSTTGEWKTETTPTQHGSGYRIKAGVLARGAGNDQTSATATWKLNVAEAGKYEVCVRYPRMAAGASNAQYLVETKTGMTTATADQRHGGGQWVRLGDYEFEKGAGRITLTDRVTSAGRTVAADAVRAERWP